jgi:hypothetical protein
MFLVGLIFLSGICISLVAAYFSIVGLATMFPGSMEAIVIMGAVLEVGKLVAAVWLHKNWHEAFGFLKYYLLLAVVVLSAITSMGIFGFLSKSHVEHGASIEKEEAIISQIESKIERKQQFIDQRKDLLSQFEKQNSSNDAGSNSIIKRLDDRIKSMKEEEASLLETQQELLNKYNNQESLLNQELEDSKKSNGFFGANNFNTVNNSQKPKRESIQQDRGLALSKINSIKKDTLDKISAIRQQIDSVQFKEASNVVNDPKVNEYRSEIEAAYNEISDFENQKFEYGATLRALETEIGPIKYIVGALDEWVGLNVNTEQAIRIIIIVLIFVFDPLAILLLIAATITYSKNKEEDLPPEIREIRNKLLDELEEYINEGGLAEHFIERTKK